MISYILKILITGLIQSGMIVILYRARVIYKSPFAMSDLITFIVPLVAGFVIYAAIFWFSDFLKNRLLIRIAGTFIISILQALFFLFIAMLVALNIYGS